MESERQLMEPVITVVIPVFNCEKYVERAVRSVLGQPCADRAEVLVVDDGSKDRSGEICDRLAAAHKTVRVIHKENGGVSSARNLGIEQAAGRYIAFLDSDDWWEPDFLDQELVHRFTVGGYEFAYRTVNYYRNLGRVFSVKDETLIYTQSKPDRYDWHSFCSYVYNTAFLRSCNLQFPPTFIWEDIAFIESTLYMAKCHERINRVIFSYWECLSSCLHTNTLEDKLLQIKASYEAKWRYLADHGSQVNQLERQIALTVAECLPRLCTEVSPHRASIFVDTYCNQYLRQFPQARLWTKCQRTLDAYNAHPVLFWIKSRVLTGIPLTLKQLCYRVPGLRWVANMFFSRFVLKMVPI